MLGSAPIASAENESQKSNLNALEESGMIIAAINFVGES